MLGNLSYRFECQLRLRRGSLFLESPLSLRNEISFAIPLQDVNGPCDASTFLNLCVFLPFLLLRFLRLPDLSCYLADSIAYFSAIVEKNVDMSPS